MKQQEFDLQQFKREMGLDKTCILQPYDYEKYKSICPELTVPVYERIRNNMAELKIVAGMEVLEFGEFGEVLLPARPHLNRGSFSANYRYYMQHFHVRY